MNRQAAKNAKKKKKLGGKKTKNVLIGDSTESECSRLMVGKLVEQSKDV
jgi:hypothetical protein